MAQAQEYDAAGNPVEADPYNYLPPEYRPGPYDTQETPGGVDENGNPRPNTGTVTPRQDFPARPAATGAFDRTRFRDQWMAQGQGADIQKFIADHPEFATGVTASGDRITLPTGEVIDSTFDSGAGGLNRASWTGTGVSSTGVRDVPAASPGNGTLGSGTGAGGVTRVGSAQTAAANNIDPGAGGQPDLGLIDPNLTGTVEQAQAHLNDVAKRLLGREITPEEFNQLAQAVGYTGGAVTGKMVNDAIQIIAQHAPPRRVTPTATDTGGGAGTGNGNGSGSGNGHGDPNLGVDNNPYGDEIHKAILGLLDRANRPVTNEEIDAQYAPVSAQMDRGAQRAKASSAEAAAFQGVNNGGAGGALDATNRGIDENLALGQGGLKAQLIGDEINRRRNDVALALSTATGEEKTALSLQLAKMDDALARLGLKQGNDQFNASLSQQDRQFGRSLTQNMDQFLQNLNLQREQMSQQNRQFYDQFGSDQAYREYLINQAIQAGLVN